MTPRRRGLPIRLCLPTLQSILCIRHRPHLGSSALMRWHFALCFRQPSHERRCCAGCIEKLPPRSSWKTSEPLGDIILREADMDETRDALAAEKSRTGGCERGNWTGALRIVLLKSSTDGFGHHDSSSSASKPAPGSQINLKCIETRNNSDRPVWTRGLWHLPFLPSGWQKT